MKPEELKTILSSAGINGNVNTRDTIQAVELFSGTETHINFINALELKETNFNESKEMVFSEDEMINSSYYRIIANAYCGYPQPEDGYIEKSYDRLTGCPRCGNGMVQKSELHMNKPKMGSKDIAGIHWVYEFAVTSRLKQMIESQELTGCELWPIISPKTKKKHEEVYQLHINSFMPPMSAETSIIKSGVNACECGKTGYMLEGLAYYTKDSLQNTTDFNKTSEWLGGGHGSWQLIIVQKAFYNMYKSHKLKGIRFEPVFVT